MSLKGGLSDSEIRKAIANNKLSEYVDNGTISPERYNEILKIYGVPHRINKDKKDRELSRKIKSVLSVVILFVSMSCGLVYVIERCGKGTAILYFFLWIWAIAYAYNK